MQMLITRALHVYVTSKWLFYNIKMGSYHAKLILQQAILFSMF